MKNKKVLITIISFTILVFTMHISGFRFSTTSSLSAANNNSKFSTIREYVVDRNNIFIVYTDEYGEYGYAKVNCYSNLLYKVHSYHTGTSDTPELGIKHVGCYLGGYYLDYVIVDNDSIAYVVFGDINEVADYNGNLLELIDKKNRYKENIIIKEVVNKQVCDWGRLVDDQYKFGKLSVFDADGDLIGFDAIY